MNQNQYQLYEQTEPRCSKTQTYEPYTIFPWGENKSEIIIQINRTQLLQHTHESLTKLTSEKTSSASVTIKQINENTSIRILN